ncbi:MAG: desulfoferrodoxin family protein [Bacilli bacterium]|jgi:superoxide reductase
MKDLRFYKCDVCGNFIEMIHDAGINPFCCKQPMTEIVANTKEDVALEKHLPVLTKDGAVRILTVGSTIHPMTEAHYIPFIILVTNKAVHRADLTPKDKPVARFVLDQDEVEVAAYEYCNLHGLWKVSF